MLAGLDPADLKARLERLRLAQAQSLDKADTTHIAAQNVPSPAPRRPPTRGYMPSAAPALSALPSYAPLRPARPVDLGVFDKDFEAAGDLQGSPIDDWGNSPLGDRVRRMLLTPGPHHTREPAQPSLRDRLLFNEADAYDNTVLGAAGLAPPRLTSNGLMTTGRSVLPRSMTDAYLQRQRERVREFKARETFPLPAPRGLGQLAAAGAGRILGNAQSPESWILWSPTGRLASAIFDGAVDLAGNLAVQGSQVEAGLRDEISLPEIAESAALGAGKGQIDHSLEPYLTEALAPVGRQLRKADDAISREWKGFLEAADDRLGRAGGAASQGWTRFMNLAGDQFNRASDPMMNFEAWQYLRDLLQRRSALPSPSGNPGARALPQPDIPGAMPPSQR